MVRDKPTRPSYVQEIDPSDLPKNELPDKIIRHKKLSKERQADLDAELEAEE
jgi:hypothetical protein